MATKFLYCGNRGILATMIYNGEEQIVKDLKAGKLFSVYLIYGQEAYLKDLYTKKISEKAVGGDLNDFNLNSFEGKKLTLDELSDSVEALPLMSARRCVIVTDLDIEKMVQADHKKLCELLDNPPETTVLIIVLKELAIDPKKSAKSKKIIELIDKVGAVILLNNRDKSQLTKFIKSKCEKSGCNISSDNANYMVERCSGDMGILNNELDKLCYYVKDGEITKVQIDKVTVLAIDTGVYDLSRAILKGDYSGSMEILSDLLYLKELPVSILSILSYSFIDLYRAKIAKSSGKTSVEVIADFDYKRKEFLINNAFRDCTKYSETILQKILGLIISADYRLKSSKADNKIIMEQLITEIFIELQKRENFD